MEKYFELKIWDKLIVLYFYFKISPEEKIIKIEKLIFSFIFLAEKNLFTLSFYHVTIQNKSFAQ